ncbi:energy transducer TonB [Ferruginibacter sp.]
MKKSIQSFFVIVTAAGLITSCNSSSDYADSTTTVAPTPTPMMNDTTVAASNNTMMTDTAMAPKMNDSMGVKKMGDKKMKKAKVMIEMPTAKYSARKLEMDKQGYYNTSEVLPSYPGGQTALINFFNNNIEYPQQATDNGTEGLVNISFLVDENGKISSPEIVSKKVGDGVEEEAMRVFNKMPSWTAGQIKGKNVKTRFTLPVKFQVSQ